MLIASIFALSACGNKDDKKTVEVSNYDELKTAIEGDSEIIKLSADIVANVPVIINRTVILDMNSKKISNTEDIWNETIKQYTLISIEDDANVTIKGNGTIQAKKDDCYAIDVIKGNLTIENGTIKGNCSAVQLVKGIVTIFDGYFEDQQKYTVGNEPSYRYTLNCIDANYKDNSAKFVVKGGTFVNFNPANCFAEGENTNFVADGYTSELVDGSTTDYKVVKVTN